MIYSQARNSGLGGDVERVLSYNVGVLWNLYFSPRCRNFEHITAPPRI